MTDTQTEHMDVIKHEQELESTLFPPHGKSVQCFLCLICKYFYFIILTLIVKPGAVMFQPEKSIVFPAQ